MTTTTTITCPHCSEQCDPTENFCEHCFKQIKCLSCSNALKAKAPICLKCGLAVGSQPVKVASPNTILLEEKVDQAGDRFVSSKRLEVGITDLAVPTLGALFVNGIGSGLSRGVSVVHSSGRAVGPIIPETAAHVLAQEATPAETDPDTQQDPPAAKPSEPAGSSAIEELFTINSAGELVCHVTDFKGSNRKEQQIRFILLASFAREHFEQGATTREWIYQVARTANIFDSNMRIYVAPVLKEHYFSDGPDAFKLKKSGKDQVERIMLDIASKSGEEGFRYWDASAKSGRSKPSKKHDQELVTEWLSKTSSLDSFNVTHLKRTREHVVFAYWLITHALGLAKGAHPGNAYEFYRQKYVTIPISREQFGREVSRPETGKVVGHTPDGLYYTLDEGNAMAAEFARSQGIEPPYTI